MEIEGIFRVIFDDAKPGEWIAKDGDPPGSKGLASFESASRRLLVFDLLIVVQENGGNVRMYPHHYGSTSLETAEGLVSVHRHEDALRTWRPQVYHRHIDGWSRLGSQHEIAWRYGMSKLMGLTHIEKVDEEELLVRYVELEVADKRAERLLHEQLTPLQRIELARKGSFRVRGGRTGNLYQIELGQGFDLLNKTTNETVISYCLHPEHYIPFADTALATKLALEDAELEVRCLENAHGVPRKASSSKTKAMEVARDLEKSLIT